MDEKQFYALAGGYERVMNSDHRSYMVHKLTESLLFWMRIASPEDVHAELLGQISSSQNCDRTREALLNLLSTELECVDSVSPAFLELVRHLKKEVGSQCKRTYCKDERDFVLWKLVEDLKATTDLSFSRNVEQKGDPGGKCSPLGGSICDLAGVVIYRVYGKELRLKTVINIYTEYDRHIKRCLQDFD